MNSTKLIETILIVLVGTCFSLTAFYFALAFHFYDLDWMSNHLPDMKSIDRDSIIIIFFSCEVFIVGVPIALASSTSPK